jgi:DNA-binding NarL/FixJ family response regulator
MSRRPSVLIAEDHELMSQGLRAMLEDSCRIVGMVSDGRDVVDRVLKGTPDVLLLDLSLPHRTGLDILEELRDVAPGVRVVVVTMHVDAVLVDAALQLGAAAFIPKNADVEELRTAIAEVLEGRRYLSPRLPRQTYGSTTDRMGFMELTARQREIVRMIGRGLSTADMAASLGISEFTIHAHRKNIRRKLGLQTDFEMLRYAILVQLADDQQPPADAG